MFYDVGVLADDGIMFCHCEHCKSKWEKHLKERSLDPKTSLPVPGTGRDMSQAINRDHLRWRYACAEDGWMLVRNAVKAKHPNFVLGPNSSDKEADNTAAAAIMGRGQVYDFLDFEEWGHGGAPYSAACSCLLGLADGDRKPVVMLWNGGDIRTEVQARTALAEAYATGAFCQNAPGAAKFNDFLKRYEEYFAYTTSAANVGVVYSAWSREFYDVPKKSHAYYWFGQMLLDMHVPFDYLLAEQDLTAENLSRYKALVLPDLGCLSNGQYKALAEYVEGGGAIYATHHMGKYDEDLRPRTPWAIEALAGQAPSIAFRQEIGSGKVAYNPGLPEKDYWDKNPRDLNKAKEVAMPAPPPADVADALNWVFQGHLPVEVNAKSSTMITLHRQENRILVHLVNYNAYSDGKELTPDRNIELRLQIPPDHDVAAVTAISPDWTKDRTLDGWRVEKQQVHFTLDELDSYVVIAVELKAKNLQR